MTELTEFIREELYPELTRSFMSVAFPKFEFRKLTNYWVSPFYLSGERSHRKDKTFVYVGGHCITENGGDSISIIDFTRRLYGQDYITAVKYLANICHLTLPLSDTDNAKYKEYQRKTNTILDALQIAQKTLFMDAGAAVLEYLHTRGYNDSLIHKMELGILTPAVQTLLNDGGFAVPSDYCNKFPLMIVYKSFGRLIGFKFRCITPVSEGGKYRNTKNLNSKLNTHPYLFGINNSIKDLYVVEGELDALHAYAIGISNVCAVSGVRNGLPLETLQIIKNNGYERVIFVPDNDDAGQNFVIKTLKNTKSLPCDFFVKSLPEAVKDLDAFLVSGSKAAFDELPIYAANVWWAGIYEQEFSRVHGTDFGQNAVLVDEFVSSVIDIASYGSPVFEESIKINLASACGCTLGALNSYIARNNSRKNEVLRLDNALEYAKSLSELVDKKNTQDISAVTKSFLQSEAKYCPDVKYQGLKNIMDAAQVSALFCDGRPSINTQIVFDKYCSGIDAPRLRLQIPTGALTVVAAPTSHGKSTFLRNLVFDFLDTEKCTLYFTLEESKKEVLAQFINTYLFQSPEFQSCQNSLIGYIKRYLGGMEIDKFCGSYELLQTMKSKINAFLETYIYSGKLRIIDENMPAVDLLASLEYLAQNIQIGAVFIDYIQIINYDSTKMRTEAIKNMCLSLKDYAIQRDIPVIIAAQLNRDVKTPFRLDNINLAECADIERAANTIICLWNSQFKSAVYGLKAIGKDEQAEIDRLTEEGFVMGTPGQIFIKITKQRADRGVGMYAIYKYEGAKGLITAP